MPIPLPLMLISFAGLLVLLFLIMALMGVARSRNTNDPNDDPRCGACGCIIADPTRLICPTCGSSISAVGLVLPFSKRRTSSWTTRQAFFKVTALPLALWTLFIVGLAVGGTYVIDQWLLPYIWQTTSTVHARPRSRDCQAITISTLQEYYARGRAQFGSPSAIKTTRLELKTDTGSHVLEVDLLGPAFAFTDATGKLVMNDRLPTSTDLTAFMLSSGIPIDSNATQEAGIIAAMLSNIAPQETLVISSRDARSAPKLDTTQIVFNGGQWKTAIPLQTLATYISPGLWFIGFIFIIWRQRRRRGQLAAALLAPPLPTLPPVIPEDDAIGGWDITVDGENPFQNRPSPPRLPATARHSPIKNA
jgi:hypothetical protein